MVRLLEVLYVWSKKGNACMSGLLVGKIGHILMSFLLVMLLMQVFDMPLSTGVRVSI